MLCVGTHSAQQEKGELDVKRRREIDEGSLRVCEKDNERD